MAIPSKERAANLARINRVITTISTDLTIHGTDLKETVRASLESTLKFYQRKQESLQNLTETLSA
tara:strand:+ start:1531 stop:1725 length:195 start_codon:yes stop_codon:yes gene_type:complete